MKRFGLALVVALAALWLGAMAPAAAQNATCPTMPVGDASNACASTAYISNAVSNIQGTLIMSGTWPGDSAPSNAKIYWLGGTANAPGMTGTCDNSGQACAGGISFLVNVGVTEANLSIPELIRGVAYLQSTHNGSFVTGDFILVLAHTTAGPKALVKYYQGLNAGFIGQANDNGTGTGANSSGNAFGFASYCILNNTATFYTECSAQENDIAISTGASVDYAYGFKSVLYCIGSSCNAVAPLVDGAAYTMAVQAGGTATWVCGYCSGANGGASPLAASADFIGHRGAGTKPNITNGINMSGWTVSSYALLLPDAFGGFTGFGNVALASARVVVWQNLTTLSSPALNVVATASYASNGTVPTLTGSCSTNTQTGGATAGTFKATCAAQTVVIALPTSANGWQCDAQDQTTPADTLKQTANTNNSVTLTGTTVAADVISFKCMGF